MTTGPKDTVQVPRELLEALVDNTRELKGERDWWKDEPRRNYQGRYQGRYQEYCDEIEQAEAILRGKPEQ